MFTRFAKTPGSAYTPVVGAPFTVVKFRKKLETTANTR